MQSAMLGPGVTKLKNTCSLSSRSSKQRQMWKERSGLQRGKCHHRAFLQRQALGGLSAPDSAKVLNEILNSQTRPSGSYSCEDIAWESVF